MDPSLSIIGRSKALFSGDISAHYAFMAEEIAKSSFLVLGGAGSIGQAIAKQLFSFSPQKLHIVDISENNLVELVRDIRCQYGYIQGDFQTFALDIGATEYDAFISSDGQYDYVLNLSALKHVRSEKDPFTLMRMLNVNIINTEKTLNHAIKNKAKKYFCVSTDKAAAPVNLMGASKRIMELLLLSKSGTINISTARFANVAFSDGSLLHGFSQRILKNQALAAPDDIQRYFVTPTEAGQLCLLACLLGNNGEIFFPKTGEKLPLISFEQIAKNYLNKLGYEAIVFDSEEEAREHKQDLKGKHCWPCYFSCSDTTGEKPVEEFYTQDEMPDFSRFADIGVLQNSLNPNSSGLIKMKEHLNILRQKGFWQKKDIVKAIMFALPDLQHNELGKNLDQKM